MTSTGDGSSAETTIEARARYLHREHTLIEFADSLLVTDHPPRLGGLDKGPSPGDVLLAALTSSTVLAAMRANRSGQPITAVARGMFRTRQVRAAGPMATYAHLARMPRRIELSGALPDDELEAIAAAAASCAVARTLASGVRLDERVELLPPLGAHTAAPPANEAWLENERTWGSLDHGAVVQDADAPAPAARWSVSALALDSERALVDLRHQSLLFGHSPASHAAGPSPIETVLGSLAACTAIFIGRWAGLRAIPIESVSVRVRATTTFDADGQPAPLTTIEKITELRADLGAHQFEVLDFVAGNCVIGETLKHGTEIDDEIVITRTPAAAGVALGAFQSGAPGAVDAAGDAACEDDSCCVVDPAAIDAAFAAGQSPA